MKDITGEYAQMLEAFECDFALARDDGYGVDDLYHEEAVTGYVEVNEILGSNP